jgi:hypothetical protein
MGERTPNSLLPSFQKCFSEDLSSCYDDLDYYFRCGLPLVVKNPLVHWDVRLEKERGEEKGKGREGGTYHGHQHQ